MRVISPSVTKVCWRGTLHRRSSKGTLERDTLPGALVVGESELVSLRSDPREPDPVDLVAISLRVDE